MSYPSGDSLRSGPPTPAIAPPEQVVAGLSSDAVGITTSFDGSEIILYGAVRRQTRIKPGPLDIIATLEGPARSVTIRRKERKFGIWLNTDSVVVGAAPGFYSVATTGDLDRILSDAEDARYRVSIPTVMRAFARPMSVSDPIDFTEAMVAARIEDGSYRLESGEITLAGDTLFRADFHLPANIIEGTYKIRIFLLREGRVVDAYSAPLEVRKVGLERWLYRLAIDRPALYGVMSLLIAAFAGWAASAAFRALRRK